MKTVGELIDALSKYPRDTKFGEYSQGHYCVHRETNILISEDYEPLSHVVLGKVVEREGTRELRLSIYS